MALRGVDISGYQSALNIADVIPRNNIDFVFIQSNDGTVANPSYAAQLAATRQTGAAVAAYVYQRPNWQQTLDTLRGIVSTDTPVIVDAEDGSGDITVTHALHDALHAAGYRTPLLYLPKFWWTQIGSPDLSGLPPLWKSWYPDNVSRPFDAGMDQLPGSVWDSYGGQSVKIVQFTGVGRLDGYDSNLDLNTFPGTRDDLNALLGATTSGGGFLMALEDWQQQRIFDRVLSMSEGVAGQNYDGDQFASEKKWRDDTTAQIAALTAAVAASTKDPNITLDALKTIIDDSIKANAPVVKIVGGDLKVTPEDPAAPATPTT